MSFRLIEDQIEQKKHTVIKVTLDLKSNKKSNIETLFEANTPLRLQKSN